MRLVTGSALRAKRRNLRLHSVMMRPDIKHGPLDFSIANDLVNSISLPGTHRIAARLLRWERPLRAGLLHVFGSQSTPGRPPVCAI